MNALTANTLTGEDLPKAECLHIKQEVQLGKELQALLPQEDVMCRRLTHLGLEAGQWGCPLPAQDSPLGR